MAAIHEHGAAAHGAAREYVLASGFFHKPLGRDDFCITVGTKDSQHATEVVDVGVGEDNRGNRFRSQVFPCEGNRGRSRFLCRQRVDQNPASVPLDNTHIGEIKAAQLVKSRRHLEQPVDVVQCRLPPQTGVDRIRCLTLDKIIGWHIPDQVALGTRYLQCFGCGYQPATCILKVAWVREIQRLWNFCVGLDCGSSGGHIALAGEYVVVGLFAAGGQ